MSNYENTNEEYDTGEFTFDDLVEDVDDGGKKGGIFKVILGITAVIVVALAVVLAGLYSKKSQLNEQVSMAAAAEPLVTDSVSWGVKNVSDMDSDVSESESTKTSESSSESSTKSDMQTMELIRSSVYEQLKDGIKDGTIVINEGDSDGVTDEQLQKLTEEISKEVSSSIDKTTATVTDSQKESIVREVISQVGNNGLSDNEIRSIVYNTISTMDLKGERGATGAAGSAGKDGKDGKDGEDGEDGKTPVRGIDYFTDSDVDSMVSRVATEIISNGDITVTAKGAYEVAVENGYLGTEEEFNRALAGISSISDIETIKDTIYSIIDNTYQPYVTQNSNGVSVLTIPVGGTNP